jgi:hypothetical protein
VQLFTIPIRAATPSKSQGEISVRGEGSDTPCVTIAATVFEQCLAMYFESLNEALACLVCIINVVRFEFRIQTLFFYSNQVI